MKTLYCRNIFQNTVEFFLFFFRLFACERRRTALQEAALLHQREIWAICSMTEFGIKPEELNIFGDLNALSQRDERWRLNNAVCGNVYGLNLVFVGMLPCMLPCMLPLVDIHSWIELPCFTSNFTHKFYHADWASRYLQKVTFDRKVVITDMHKYYLETLENNHEFISTSKPF